MSTLEYIVHSTHSESDTEVSDSSNVKQLLYVLIPLLCHSSSDLVWGKS